MISHLLLRWKLPQIHLHRFLLLTTDLLILVLSILEYCWLLGLTNRLPMGWHPTELELAMECCWSHVASTLLPSDGHCLQVITYIVGTDITMVQVNQLVRQVQTDAAAL